MRTACVYLPCDRCDGEGCKACGFTGEIAICFRCPQCGGRMDRDMIGWFCPDCDLEGDEA